MVHVQLDHKIIKAFKRAYVNALYEGQEYFTFDSREFYVPYARHLIAFAEKQIAVPFNATT